MKTAQSLDTLFYRAEQFNKTLVDLVAPMDELRCESEGDSMLLHVGDYSGPLTDSAFAQTCRSLKIPVEYATRCLEGSYEIAGEPIPRAPIIAAHMNHWLRNPVKNANKLIRGIDMSMYHDLDHDLSWRAVLSDHYFPFDSFDMLREAMKVCSGLEKKFGKPQWASGEITPDRMAAKITFPGMQREIKHSRRVGDIVQWGLYIANNEIGSGMWRVRGFCEWLACTNGMVSTRTLLDANGEKLQYERRHVGSKLAIDSDSGIQWGDETRGDAKRLQLSMLRDTIAHILDPATLDTEIRIFENAAANDLRVVDGEKSIKRLASDQTLSDEESKQILHSFLADGDSTQFGLAQAICSDRVARTLSYDRATAFERLAYNVIALPRREWSALALAA
jgi:hypothetical protein